ncbi:RHS repeat-associated core domain-containing protein, partial [Xenorhabdus bovienii]|nr:RHS repeat-associated core domain-containing protein [Xenorhabdus bovienii]
LNAYAYCLGDPINRIDPTGHMSLGSIFGVILGSIGLVAGIIMAIPTGGASLSVGGAIIAGLGLLADATGIASAATEDSNPHVSSILGWVSLGFGVVVGMGA